MSSTGMTKKIYRKSGRSFLGFIEFCILILVGYHNTKMENLTLFSLADVVVQTDTTAVIF